MKYLYITGLMRSGTTLVANFLNSQENITLYADFCNYMRSMDNQNQLEFTSTISEESKNRLRFAAKTEFQSMTGRELNLDSDFDNALDLYKMVLNAVSNSNDAFVGNKSTESLNVLSNLIIDDNEIYGIYIMRDIRDILLSFKNSMMKNSKFEVYSRIEEWKTNYKLAIDLQQKYPNNFLILKYEDFVQMKSSDILENFLSLKIDWTISEFKSRNQGEWTHNSSFNDLKLQKGIQANAVARWKSYSDDYAVRSASILCKKELEELGYEELSNINLLDKIMFYILFEVSKIRNLLKIFLKKIVG